MRLPSDADASGRDFKGDELSLLREVLDSGTLNCTKGTQVKSFEKEFAALYGVNTCRAITSGTGAVHCAVAAAGLEPGDEVITTTVTDMGAITPILYEQGKPIFADVDPVSLNVTPQTVEAKITGRTKAIIATHLFGNPCDIEGIRAVAGKKGILVIEDCAQSYLATQNGRLTGTIGHIGAFSLQQGKHMTTGEGGMVITDDVALARHMILFSDKAWGYGDPNPDHYFMAINYRMTELAGAVARAQLRKLESVVARRRSMAALLDEKLRDLDGIVIPETLPGCTHVYWKYSLMVDPNIVAGGPDALAKQLKEESGIFTVPRYVRKPAFECMVLEDPKSYTYCGGKPHHHRRDYPGTMKGLDRVLVLPWNEHYTEAHVDFIAANIRRAVESLAMARMAA